MFSLEKSVIVKRPIEEVLLKPFMLRTSQQQMEIDLTKSCIEHQLEAK